jgi:hypothetical protein
MEFLSECNGEVDFVELEAAGQWRTLPPALSPVDGILGRVRPRRLSAVTVVAQLALDNFELADHVVLVRVGSRQLAEQLGFSHPDTTSCSCLNLSSDGKVEVWRR